MSALGATELPKPKDWQAFERALCILAQSHFNDPAAQLNGVGGQAQQGVDVFGYRDGDPAKLFGLQAKRTEKSISEKELEKEVTEARKFEPPLTEYFLITTAKRDANLQTKARLINQELADEGLSMRVTVWFWDDITEIAQGEAAIWRAFDPTFTSFAEQEGKETRFLIERRADQHDGRFNEISGKLENIAKSVDRANGAGATSFIPDEPDSTPRHGQITAWVTLINDHQAKLAERYLEQEINEAWDEASPTEQYRLKAALAGARLKLGKFDAAAALLEEAIALDQYPEKTAVNGAKTALLTGDYANAEKLAFAVRHNYPENDEIYGILVQARANQFCENDPRDGVPEKDRSKPEVHAGYIHWLRGRDDETWRQVAEKAAANNPDSTYLKAAAAEGVLDAVTGKRQGYIGGALPFELDHNALAEAAAVLGDYAEQQIATEEYLEESALHNAVLALRMIENRDRALRLFESGVKLYPESEHLILQGAILYLTTNEPQKALDIVSAETKANELKLLRIEILVVGGQGLQALAELDDIDAEGLPVERRRMFDSVKVRTIASAKSTSDALAYLHDAQRKEPRDLHLKVVEIGLLATSGDRDGAIEVLNTAAKLLDDDTDFVDRFELAREGISLDAYDSVVTILEGHIAGDHISEGLQMLIMAALNAGLHRKAHDILNGVSPEAAGHPFIKRAEAVLAINTGEPDTAVKIKASLAARADDIEMVIALILNMHSLQKERDIRRYLVQLDERALRGDPESFITLAQLYVQYGMQSRGMSLGYAQLLENWKNPSVHLRYQGLVFGAGDDISLIPETSEVAPDTAVGVSLDDGPTFVFLIADEEYGAFTEQRLKIDDPLAVSLRGAKVGDVIDVDRGDSTQSYTIKTIRHKWLFAFQHSLETYEKRFPTSQGLRSIAFDTEADDPYVEMRRLTRAQAERADHVLSGYDEGKAPQCMIAEALGADPVEVWRGMAAEGRTFHTCLGAAEERMHAIQAIIANKKQGAVVDAVTIAMINEFGVRDAVENVLGPLKTTESVITVFEKRVADMEMHEGKKYLSIAWRNNELQRTLIDEEGVATAIKFRRDELAWVRKNFEVIPAMPREDPDGQWRTTLEMLPRASVQAAAAAQGGSYILLSEDLGYRQWATATYGIGTTWLQPVLLRASEKQLMSAPEFAEAMCAMVRFGHQYVSLNALALTEIARRDGFAVSLDLQAMLNMIGGPNAELATNPGIVASLIDDALTAKGRTIETLALSSAVFRAMAKGRMAYKGQIVNLILLGLENKRQWMKDHANAWVFGHSIGEISIDQTKVKKKIA